ncbi:MAG: hypothetical protein IT422_00460 [Pirellulaceae bacterium]|nr:hypothetical protein [Pirellulaceae bacterium]
MAEPVFEIRRGLIKVRIWQRKTKNGVRFSLTVVRLFRNGDQWKESTRLGRDDIPLVRLLLDKAHTWILNQGGEQQ